MFFDHVPARTQEYQGTKWRFTPGGQALWLYCLECHRERWPQDRGLSMWAAFVNGGGIDCVSMSEVSIWKTYERLFVKIILNDSMPLSWNWGSGSCALLVDAARMGGLRTGFASQIGPRLWPLPRIRGAGSCARMSLVSPNQRSSGGWELSLGARSFLFLPWMLRTGGAFCDADPAAEKEEVAAPGRSTFRKLLGCGNASMMWRTWGCREQFYVNLCKLVALLGSFDVFVSELVNFWVSGFRKKHDAACALKGKSAYLR